MKTVWTFVLLLLCATAGFCDEEYFISRFPAKVVPNRVETSMAEESGWVEIFPPDSERVRRGTLLAKLNGEFLELEEKELKEQLEEDVVECSSRLLQLKRQREELEFAAKLPPNQRIFIEKRSGARVDERAIQLLDDKMRLLEKKSVLSREKIRRLFEKKKEKRLILMPFDGRVRFHVSLPEKKGDRTPIQAASPVVTAADDSAVFVAVEMREPKLAMLTPGKMSVRCDLGNGDMLRAKWAYKRVEKTGQIEALVYYFCVAETDRDKAWSLLGSNLVVRLYFQGDQDWLYEEKVALIREAGERHYQTWDELVEHVRPGWTIVFSGETHLCLRKI